MGIRDEIKQVNTVISGTLDLYAVWAKRYNLNYNELMVLYTLHDYKICTPKQICDWWAIPKQTVHGILLTFEKKCYITVKKNSDNKRERLVSFTDIGLSFAQTVLKPLYEIEENVMRKMGKRQRNQFISCNTAYFNLMKEAINNEN